MSTSPAETVAPRSPTIWPMKALSRSGSTSRVWMVVVMRVLRCGVWSVPTTVRRGRQRCVNEPSTARPAGLRSSCAPAVPGRARGRGGRGDPAARADGRPGPRPRRMARAPSGPAATRPGRRGALAGRGRGAGTGPVADDGLGAAPGLGRCGRPGADRCAGHARVRRARLGRRDRRRCRGYAGGRAAAGDRRRVGGDGARGVPGAAERAVPTAGGAGAGRWAYPRGGRLGPAPLCGRPVGRVGAPGAGARDAGRRRPRGRGGRRPAVHRAAARRPRCGAQPDDALAARRRHVRFGAAGGGVDLRAHLRAGPARRGLARDDPRQWPRRRGHGRTGDRQDHPARRAGPPRLGPWRPHRPGRGSGRRRRDALRCLAGAGPRTGRTGAAPRTGGTLAAGADPPVRGPRRPPWGGRGWRRPWRPRSWSASACSRRRCGSSSGRPPTGRSSSWSTTPTRPTARVCGSSPTSPDVSAGCRSPSRWPVPTGPPRRWTSSRTWPPGRGSASRGSPWGRSRRRPSRRWPPRSGWPGRTRSTGWSRPPRATPSSPPRAPGRSPVATAAHRRACAPRCASPRVG